MSPKPLQFQTDRNFQCSGASISIFNESRTFIFRRLFAASCPNTALLLDAYDAQAFSGGALRSVAKSNIACLPQSLPPRTQLVTDASVPSAQSAGQTRVYMLHVIVRATGMLMDYSRVGLFYSEQLCDSV